MRIFILNIDGFFDPTKSIVGGLGTSVWLPSLIPDDKDEDGIMNTTIIT